MLNYFYIDAKGRMQGPVDKQRLQKLVDWGTIEPTTLVETESGHQGMAGQISGLDFSNATPKIKYFFTDTSGRKQGPINKQQLQALITKGIITSMTPLETGGGNKGVAGQIPGLDFNFVEPPVEDQTGEDVWNQQDEDGEVWKVPGDVVGKRPTESWKQPIDRVGKRSTVTPSKITENVTQLQYNSDTWKSSIFSELFDFSFRDLRPETAFLWLVRSAYITGVSGVILSSLGYFCFVIYAVYTAYSTLREVAENLPMWAYFFALLPLLQLPFIIIACFLAICWLRFFCDCTIIVVHCMLNWIVEIAKLLRAARIYVEGK